MLFQNRFDITFEPHFSTSGRQVICGQRTAACQNVESIGQLSIHLLLSHLFLDVHPLASCSSYIRYLNHNAALKKGLPLPEHENIARCPKLQAPSFALNRNIVKRFVPRCKTMVCKTMVCKTMGLRHARIDLDLTHELDARLRCCGRQNLTAQLTAEGQWFESSSIPSSAVRLRRENEFETAQSFVCGTGLRPEKGHAEEMDPALCCRSRDMPSHAQARCRI